MTRHVALPLAGLGMIVAVACGLPQPAAGQSLPASLREPGSGLRESGEGRFRYFGFHIYDARLWVEGDRFAPERPFALGLKYAREFSGDSIAQSSADEIRRIEPASASKLPRWIAEMRKVFPDVKPGDELVGKFWPRRGVQFFHNGRAVGEIADTEFAQAFFGIWLDPRTRAVDLRRALLGEK